MTVLTADELWLSRLRGVMEPVEIRDPSGNLLGHYTPALTPEQAAHYAKIKGLFDLEEAERALADPHPGYTYAEVMEHARSLEKKAGLVSAEGRTL